MLSNLGHRVKDTIFQGLGGSESSSETGLNRPITEEDALQVRHSICQTFDSWLLYHAPLQQHSVQRHSMTTVEFGSQLYIVSMQLMSLNTARAMPLFIRNVSRLFIRNVPRLPVVLDSLFQATASTQFRRPLKIYQRWELTRYKVDVMQCII